MPLLLLAIVLLLPLAFVVLLPLSLVQRYRVGTSRRVARRWVAALNLVMVAISIAMLLAAAALMAIWVPRAFASAIMGLGAGGALGIIGLRATRWEATPRGLHYTPSRWFVLAITLVVAARLSVGLWRSWQAWRAGTDATSWLATAGVAGSLAAGALVLGYYAVYWFGVRRRVQLQTR